MRTIELRPARSFARKGLAVAAVCGAVLAPPSAGAQGFTSGSNGTDGALNLTTPGTVVFDPGSLGIDADRDGVYHFTSITIGSGVTVKLSADLLGEGTPVVWLAQGVVQIDGTIDLDGQSGHGTSLVYAATAGAGGYGGGTGAILAGVPSSSAGNGPGGGGTASGHHGGGAGFAIAGRYTAPATAGAVYGNEYLLPMIGGSGGGGGGVVAVNASGGGGAGGGAILIVSSVSIEVRGAISANGGNGTCGTSACGGGGSGGAIRLIAPTVRGSGEISATGGTSGANTNGSFGRIRVEGYQRPLLQTAARISPVPSAGGPGPVFLPQDAPRITTVEVNGVAAPQNPTGSFVMPDISTTANGPVRVVLAAQNIPVGTVLNLLIVPDGFGPNQQVASDPLAGTFQASTASAQVTLPIGYSRLFVNASW